jgi:CcmD family protein
MINRIRLFVLAIAIAVAIAVPLRTALAQGARPQPQQQNEFVPVDELPQAEQLPAAPLVIAAYAVAWLAMLIYLWSIWRRLQKVDRELSEVSRRIAERARS